MVMNGLGEQATVYSHCARLTIQKLTVERNNPALADLIWIPAVGWTESSAYTGINLINPPIFNSAVYEAQDGPGYYSAEINVKGRVIYGYTWDVNHLNDQIVNQGTAAGSYRITFSFDDYGTVVHQAFFTNATQILVPVEEVTTTESSEGGAVAVVDPANNLTYIDINILNKSGSKGKGTGSSKGR
jgi:hypothetical protein